MRSSASSLSQFLSITSVALALLAGCSDDGGGDCGTTGAAALLPASVGGQDVAPYTHFFSRVGNDCPASDAPAGVISVTVEGEVATGSDAGLITFCIPRPDLLNGSHTIGKDDTTQIQLIDLTARVNDGGVCNYTLDRTAAVTGTIVGAGSCENGDSEAGFSLDVSLTATLEPGASSSCTSNVQISVSGKVAVGKAPQ